MKSISLLQSSGTVSSSAPLDDSKPPLSFPTAEMSSVRDELLADKTNNMADVGHKRATTFSHRSLLVSRKRERDPPTATDLL